MNVADAGRDEVRSVYSSSFIEYISIGVTGIQGMGNIKLRSSNRIKKKKNLVRLNFITQLNG